MNIPIANEHKSPKNISIYDTDRNASRCRTLFFITSWKLTVSPKLNSPNGLLIKMLNISLSTNHIFRNCGTDKLIWLNNLSDVIW